MRNRLVRLTLFVALTACIDSVPPRPLSISVTATPVVAAVGEPFTFVVNAQGQALVNVQAIYGDGNQETVNADGATTARVTFIHSYSTPGSFDMIARVLDGVEGQRDATVQVVVQ